MIASKPRTWINAWDETKQFVQIKNPDESSVPTVAHRRDNSRSRPTNQTGPVAHHARQPAAAWSTLINQPSG
jgi:hypothetical protein